MHPLPTLSLMLLALTLAASQSLAQADACFSDWSAASVLIRTEGLVTIDHLTKLAPAKLGGEVVRSALCETKSGYVYKLIVRDKSGQLKTHVVDAKTPFP